LRYNKEGDDQKVRKVNEMHGGFIDVGDIEASRLYYLNR